MDYKLLFAKILGRLAFYASWFWNIYVVRDPHTLWVHKWHRDHGDKTLRIDYPLTENSVVFDLGGYEGSWTADIHRRYRCRVFVFEPVPKFYENIQLRFNGVGAICVFNFGLGDASRIETISCDAEGSSIVRRIGPQINIFLYDIGKFLLEASIQRIDLIKINIEGAEYDLLDYMLAKGITNLCSDIQIQFHEFFPEAETRRHKIRSELQKTHFLTYDYPFVWENWRKRLP